MDYPTNGYERNLAISRLATDVFTQEQGEFVAEAIRQNTYNGREHVNAVMLSIATERIKNVNQIKYVADNNLNKIVMYGLCSRARLRGSMYNLFENFDGFVEYCERHPMATRVITWCDLNIQEADRIFEKSFMCVQVHPILYTIEAFLYCYLRSSRSLLFKYVVPLVQYLMDCFGDKSQRTFHVHEIRMLLVCAYSVVQLIARVTNPLPSLPAHSTIFGNYRFLCRANEDIDAVNYTALTEMILDSVLKIVAWIDMHYSGDIVKRIVKEVEHITNMPIATHLCMRHMEFDEKIAILDKVYLVNSNDDVADVTTTRAVQYDSDDLVTEYDDIQDDLVNNTQAAQEIDWTPLKRSRTHDYDS